MLELLGWADYLPQQGTARNETSPTTCSSPTPAPRTSPTPPPPPAPHAAVVEESKRFGLSLDERDREAGFHARSPHSQISATWHRRGRFGEPGPLGPAHRRPCLAAVRLPRPAPGQRLLRADLADLLAPGREEDLRVFPLKTGATVRSLIAVPSQSEGTDRLSATTTIRHFATR